MYSRACRRQQQQQLRVRPRLIRLIPLGAIGLLAIHVRTLRGGRVCESHASDLITLFFFFANLILHRVVTQSTLCEKQLLGFKGVNAFNGRKGYFVIFLTSFVVGVSVVVRGILLIALCGWILMDRAVFSAKVACQLGDNIQQVSGAFHEALPVGNNFTKRGEISARLARRKLLGFLSEDRVFRERH